MFLIDKVITVKFDNIIQALGRTDEEEEDEVDSGTKTTHTNAVVMVHLGSWKHEGNEDLHFSRSRSLK